MIKASYSQRKVVCKRAKGNIKSMEMAHDAGIPG